MNKEVSLLFALLRNALFQIPLIPEDWKNVNWDELYCLVKSHALQTLVTEPVMTLPAIYRPSVQIQNELLQLMAMNMAEHARINTDIVKVFRFLEEKGFNPVLLKGQGNATFYPKPLLRKCGDVDIYIGKNDYEGACKCLASDLEGVSVKGENNKHREFMLGQTELELHKFAEIPITPQKPSVYEKLVSEYLSQPDFLEIGGCQVPVPPVQFNAFYVFYHLYHHLKIRGIGLRQFCDVARILHLSYGKIDLQRLKDDLLGFRMMDEWVLMGPFFVEYLGLPANEYPFYKEVSPSKTRALVQLVIDDGNFAKTAGFSYKTSSRILYKIHAFYIHSLRYWCLAKVSLPLAARVYWFILKRGVKAVFLGRDI